MGGFTIRPSTVDDAEAITKLRYDGWMSAYSALMPASFLDRMRLGAPDESARRRARFATRPAACEFVAVVANTVVGWAVAGPARDADRPRQMELYALYTHASTHGTGLGAQLLVAVLGSERACVWVLEGNRRARSFYAKHGFVADGARRVLEGELSHVPEIRMVRGRVLRESPREN